MTDTMTFPQQITETPGIIHKRINHGFMVDWINRDLVNRAGNDVRHSTVLYDEDYLFSAALPAGVKLRPDVWEALYDVGVRYWSRGIV